MARIVQLANFVAPESGGIRTTLDALGAGYEMAGHERVLVVPGAEDAYDGHRLVLRGRRLPGQPYRVLTDVERVRQVVRSLRPDRIEVSDKLTLTSLGRLGPPSVLLSHERLDAILRPRVPAGVPLGRAADVANRRIGASFDRIVCASAFAAEEWRRIGQTPTVVALGVDLDTFRPQRRTGATRPGGVHAASHDASHVPGHDAGHDVELVTVGRLSGEKRPVDALTALARLRGAGVDAALTYVGDGPLRARLARAARGQRLPVRFTGHLAGRDAVAEVLAAADVAVCPCPYETFGLAALEALACGTPVAVPQGGALAELVRDGPAGCGAIDDDLAVAVATCLATGDRGAARLRAEEFCWSQSVTGMLAAHALPDPGALPSTRTGGVAA